MPPQWSAVATVIGSIVAALIGGTLGGVLARRHESGRWARDQRMTAYADLIRSYAAAYNEIAAFDDDARRGKPDWADWSRSLAVVYMVAESSVANKARGIDAALWDMHINASDSRIPSELWKALRDPLEREVLEFVNLARAELGALGAPLPSLWGRPAGHPTD